MSAHTPGPWFWNEQEQLVSSVLVEADEWASAHHPVIVETDSGVYPPEGSDRLLIAAAPELLSFVQKLLGENVAWYPSALELHMYGPYGLDGEKLEKEARALVAKATRGAA